MVEPFKELLSYFIYTKSGRKVSAFLDQQNIEWGEIWRERLTEEIIGATVFIPLLSANYLDSKNCRTEFNLFQTNASALGVRELLLPVIIIDAPAIFNETNTDDIVREAQARQWEIIEDAVLSDHGSSEWKRTMSTLAQRFVTSYEAAEAKLASLNPATLGGTANHKPDDGTPGDAGAGGTPPGGTPSGDGTNGGSSDSSTEDIEFGLTDVMEDFNTHLGAMNEAAARLNSAMTAFGEASESAGELPDDPTPKQIQAWSIRLAQAFNGPAADISAAGEQMFNGTKGLDTDIRRLHQIASELPPELGLGDNLTDMLGQLEGLDEVGRQLANLLDSMRPAEYISVPLRRALNPARRGVTRVTDSIELIKTWSQIRDELASKPSQNAAKKASNLPS